MIDRIVVGVDGSPNSRAATAWAVGLAQQLPGAELLVVHAIGLLEGHHRGGPADPAGAPEGAPPWWEEFDACPVPVRQLVVDGDPVSVLLRVADEHAADLIVVGSRGMGGRPDLLLGSTSTQVAQRSCRPVVIVPAAQDVPDAASDG